VQERLLDISCYLGFAPIFWLLGSAQRKNSPARHHGQQALALSFLLFCAFLIFVVCFSLHQIILFLSRDLFLSLPLEISFYVLGGLLAVCLVLWLAGLVSAARGTALKIPFFSQITASKKLMLFSLVWTLFLQVCLVTIVAVAVHSTHLARAEVATADVYMLYDDMGYIPRWVFTFGFYRVSLAAIERWGDGSVVVAPLSGPALNQALQNGRLVYIASHGADGHILLLGHIPYWPRDVDRTSIGRRLQYVHMTGCETGLLRVAWAKAFAPAKVKTFDRLSSTAEHVLWLFVDGPKAIFTLE